MKVVILAGGPGKRFGEETKIRPKPMIQIGGRPILWHIMMHYSAYNFNDFIIALGYKGEMIKKYMLDYSILNSNLTVNLKSGDVKIHDGHKPDWTVELIDTGKDSLTGGRIKRLARYIGRERFMLTYGDGLSDINLHDLLDFHISHGKLATMTAVKPAARFGLLKVKKDKVIDFAEKQLPEQDWVNGGFFVLEPGIIDYIEGDNTWWEQGPLQQLTQDGQLLAYRHTSFWQCMDTIRDKEILEALWESGNPPWKTWG